jgi:hypothetical protein
MKQISVKHANTIFHEKSVSGFSSSVHMNGLAEGT